ncbi:betacellulin, epidermal growth factor family member precursor [Arapaima gigas]
MARARRDVRLLFAVFIVEALCRHLCAEWNTTKEPASGSVFCSDYGNGSQCTDSAEASKWSGHFSKCPKEFHHFCVHGTCRYIEEQKTPSCVCFSGYIGSRCEYVDFDHHTGGQKHIVVACVIATLVFLILLIVFICIYAHRHKLCHWRKQKKEAKTEEAEKLNMVVTAGEARKCGSVHLETETNAVC